MGKKNKDGNVNVSMDDIQGFINIWKTFSEILNNSLEKNDITKEEEDAFLEIKTQIARKQAILASNGLLGQGKLGEEILGVTSQVVSLQDAKEISPTQIKRIKGEWHTIYLSLNSIVGHYSQFYSGDNVAKKTNPFVAFFILLFIIIAIAGVLWAITTFRS